MKTISFFKKSSTIFATAMIVIAVCTLASCQNNGDDPEPDPSVTDAGVVIDGIRWATRNVAAPGTFAATPADAGMFYQWNRRRGWSITDPLVSSDGNNRWDASITTGTEWTAQNDPCPPGWRVPTQEELESLQDAGGRQTTRNGVNGFLFGTALNQIFLPVVGHRGNILGTGVLFDPESRTSYWSSTYSGSDESGGIISRLAWILALMIIDLEDEVYAVIPIGGVANGFLVRCVAE